MNTSLASLPGTYVDSWDLFQWDSSTRSFTGMISRMDGFTGEVFDGEAVGFGIEGKTGEVLYFAIESSVMCDDDHVDYWVVRPASAMGRDLIAYGRILNG